MACSPLLVCLQCGYGILCDVFVRPLACKHMDDLWEQRWPDHPHLLDLMQSLGLSFVVHDITGTYVAMEDRNCNFAPFHLLYSGSHYELLYS